MRFESPWMFLLLLLIPAVLLWRRRRGGAPALRFSSTAAARAAGTSWRRTLSGLPEALRIAALCLFVVALARPQRGAERIRDVSRGIAIEMVVDRSSSMAAEMSYRGRNLTRLEVVKRVFSDFVDGDTGELPGRPNDLIGMISFARYADTVCPLTLSHGTLREVLKNVELVEQRPEDGTAIGDALALAAARLSSAEESLSRKIGEAQGYEIKSKIVILLTDGENNAGQRGVADAADLAAKWGVKVYAIGVGYDRNLRTPFGILTAPASPGVDDAGLRLIAEKTGGIYRLAVDADSLLDVYREIDELEKSEIQAVRYLDYRELFPPFALAGLFLIVGEVVLGGTLLRRTP